MLADLPSHAILDRGRLVGLWEYDTATQSIAWTAFVKKDHALEQAVAHTERYVREQLGDARSFSLDSPKSRAPRVAALRKAAGNNQPPVEPQPSADSATCLDILVRPCKRPRSRPANAASKASDHVPALAASYLGWLLDAFDFFLVIYCLTAIGKEFHRPDRDIALSITLTLAFRPVGAFIFGLLADRYGRRLPLMIDLVFYSVVEVATGFAPNYTTFMVLRALFGIGMGGEWGVGASLAMEKVPPRLRGLLSGFLQQGYSTGNLLAAMCYFFLFERWGWRPMFFLGGLPALLALFVRFRVEESEVWKKSREESWAHLGRAVASNWKLFIYLTLLMTAMNFSSHGTQDMYPTFLERYWHFAPAKRSAITAFSMLGALIGGMIVGLVVGPHRAPEGHGDRAGRGGSGGPALDLFAESCAAGGWRISDAVHGAGRVGCDSRASGRVVARFRARIPARIRVPVRRAAREFHRLHPGGLRRLT